MKKQLTSLLSCLALAVSATVACAQGTTFTYQGRLSDPNGPVSGTNDFQFALYDAAANGNQIGSNANVNDQPVSNGLFTVTLDFGAGPFKGTSRWLEIRVRPGDSAGAYTTFVPRQALTPAPYAIYAALAGNLPDTVTQQFNGIVTFGGAVGAPFLVVSSNKVANLNADLLDGLDSSAFWKLGGNAGTTPVTNFLGTTDNQALELKVNSQRGLRLEYPTSGSVPNLLGGYSGNSVGSGTEGAVVAGGGTSGLANSIGVDSDYSAIAGGLGHTIQASADYATISGGIGNVIEAGADAATIGGGEYQTIGTNSIRATIGGGWVNRIAGTVPGLINGSTIAGGYANTIEYGSGYSTVGGGASNLTGTNVNGGTISGGIQNQLHASRANIGGGWANTLETNADYAVISGGVRNLIQRDAMSAAIGGGHSNVIRTGAARATISGGSNNVIQANATFAAIGGGINHSLAGNHGAIAGGEHHTIEAQAEYTTIGGGSDNAIQFNADYATIAGGDNNTIQTNGYWSTIGGGANNVIQTNAQYATIPGGAYARATHYGQLAHASGPFASSGDAQTSVYVLRRTTTGASQTELFLNGASLRMTVPNGASWTFEALIVARSTTGDTAGYRLTGVVENVGGGMGGTFQAPQVLREDVAAWDASASVDNVNDALIIQVTGAASTTIRWVATVRTVEVMN